MSPTAASSPDPVPDAGDSAGGLNGRLRDLRFLVDRLFSDGPVGLEREVASYLAEYPDDDYACELRTLLRQEADLLTRHRTDTDLACTLHSRLVPRPGLLAQLQHVAEALPNERLEILGARPADPRLIRVLAEHRAPVESLDWSPDGRYLATLGAYDTTVRIWDARTWEQVHVITEPHSSLDTVLWSPDGRRLAVVGKGERFADAEEKREPGDEDDLPNLWVEKHVHTFLVFDTGTWAELGAMGNLPSASVHAPGIAWAPDGTSLA